MTESTSSPTNPPTYRDGYQPSPIGQPERTFADGAWTLVLTRTFSHPVNRVWEALTEPGQMRRWAPFVPDRDLASTGDVMMTMAGEVEPGTDATGPGQVLESEPPRLLVYRWGGDVLRWELTGTEDGTTLVLRHTFDDEGMTSALAAGWHLCLDVADALMKGTPFRPAVGSEAREYGWDDLNSAYAEVLNVKPFSG